MIRSIPCNLVIIHDYDYRKLKVKVKCLKKLIICSAAELYEFGVVLKPKKPKQGTFGRLGVRLKALFVYLPGL